jgi:hypothetical protein
MLSIRRKSAGTVLEAISPDGRWQLVLDDSSLGGDGGSRSHGNGSIALFKATTHQPVFASRELARPVDGDVSNTGRFVVHDAGWESSSGRLLVFDCDGQIPYQRRFTANILTVSMSPSGRYVLSQTLYSEESPDCEMLEVVDLETGEIPMRTKRMTSNPTAYIIEEGPDGRVDRVIACIPGMGAFSYSADGTFIDARLYKMAQIDGENLYESVLAMEALIKQGDLSAANKIIDSAPKIFERLLQINPRWAAKALRYRGEALELCNRLGDAVSAYHQALAIDPTVGVKRRIERIKNRSN